MPSILDRAFYKTQWKIERFANDEDAKAGKSYDTSIIDGNLLLNEGINELLLLLAGAGGTAFNNANTYIGVGDSNTAAAASQTGLQAATNKLYKAMNATYPTTGSQQIVAQADFGSSEGNYAWEEFTIANGNSDTAKNLNRKVSSQGTKTAGQTWRVTVTITLS
jgi:hypothetical protein